MVGEGRNERHFFRGAHIDGQDVEAGVEVGQVEDKRWQLIYRSRCLKLGLLFIGRVYSTSNVDELPLTFGIELIDFWSDRSKNQSA